MAAGRAAALMRKYRWKYGGKRLDRSGEVSMVENPHTVWHCLASYEVSLDRCDFQTVSRVITMYIVRSRWEADVISLGKFEAT